MNRSAVKVAVVALLAVGAIVAVAGTVDDLSTAGGSGAPAPSVEDDAAEQTTTAAGTTQAAGEVNLTSERVEGSTQDCIEAFRHPLVVLGILALWGAVVVGVYRRNGTVEASAAFMAIFVVLFMAYPALAVCGTDQRPSPGNQTAESVESANGSGGSGDGGDGSGEGDDTAMPDVPFALLAIVAILAVAGVGAVLVTQPDGEDDDEPFPSDEEPVEDDMTAGSVDGVAAAAGRAADRIERTDDLDNQIYRAWVDMTRHLDVEHPETSTPREFADAANAAGMDDPAIGELTELFERVRYGHEAPTEDREARALDALRRIETTYGGDSS